MFRWRTRRIIGTTTTITIASITGLIEEVRAARLRWARVPARCAAVPP
jgi:hypothetical protein